MEEALVTVHYYLRKGWANVAATVADEASRRLSSCEALVYWKSAALVLTHRVADGVRGLEQLAAKSPAIPRAVQLALEYASARTAGKTPDTAAMAHAALANALPVDLEICGQFLWYAGDLETARAALLQAQTPALLAWLDICQENADGSLLDGASGIDAQLARATVKSMSGNSQGAFEVLGTLLATHKRLIPALCATMHLHMETSAWDAAVSVAQQILAVDPAQLDALRVCAFAAATQGPDLTRAVAAINALISAASAVDPRNGALVAELLEPFLCAPQIDRSIVTDAIARALGDAEKYRGGSSAQFRALLAESKLISGDPSGAQSVAEALLAVEASDAAALVLTQSLLAQNRPEIAAKALRNGPVCGQRHYLGACQLWLSGGAASDRVAALVGASHAQAEYMLGRGRRRTFGLWRRVSPRLLLQVALDLMQHCALVEPLGDVNDSSGASAAAADLVNALRHFVPRSPALVVLHARVKVARGDVAGARALIDSARELASSSEQSEETRWIPATAALWSACIHLFHAIPDARAALADLDAAVGGDFGLRTAPLQLFLRAKAHLFGGDASAAQNVLSESHELSSEKPPTDQTPACALYINLQSALATMAGPAARHLWVLARMLAAECHDALNEPEKAEAAIAAVESASAGDRVALGQLTLARARRLLAKPTKTNVAAAIALLRREEASEGAQRLLAEVLLSQGDQAGYFACFQRMHERDPSSTNAISLSDAYLTLREPESTISVLRRALKTDPQNLELLGRIGQALEATHRFDMAVRYYEQALRDVSAAQRNTGRLQLQLAQLLHRVGRSTDALELVEKTATEGDGAIEARCGLQVLQARILIAQQPNSPPSAMALSLFQKSSDALTALIAKSPPNLRPARKHQLSDLLRDWAAALADTPANRAQLVHVLQEAVALAPAQHVELSVQLVRAQLETVQLDAAAVTVETLQKMNSSPAREHAAIFAADLAWWRGDLEEALLALQPPRLVKPPTPTILQKAVAVAAASGTLSSLKQLYPGVWDRPSFCYCKALLLRGLGDFAGAARCCDEQLRYTAGGANVAALTLRIDLALSRYKHRLVGAPFLAPEVAPYTWPLDEQHALQVLVTRLADAVGNPDDVDVQIRRCQLSLVTADDSVQAQGQTLLKQLVEKVPQLAEREKLDALVHIAATCALARHTTRARDILRHHIVDTTWTPLLAAPLEHGWLLYADLLLAHESNSDTSPPLAVAILQKVLHRNPSCGLAYEYLAVCERRAKRLDAARTAYAHAYNLQHAHFLGSADILVDLAQINVQLCVESAVLLLELGRATEALQRASPLLQAQSTGPPALRQQLLDDVGLYSRVLLPAFSRLSGQA